MCFHLMIWQQVDNQSSVCVCIILLILLVCGFEAFINGKHIIGEVKEKEQAHREYKQAIKVPSSTSFETSFSLVCLLCFFDS